MPLPAHIKELPWLTDEGRAKLARLSFDVDSLIWIGRVLRAASLSTADHNVLAEISHSLIDRATSRAILKQTESWADSITAILENKLTERDQLSTWHLTVALYRDDLESILVTVGAARNQEQVGESDLLPVLEKDLFELVRGCDRLGETPDVEDAFSAASLRELPDHEKAPWLPVLAKAGVLPWWLRPLEVSRLRKQLPTAPQRTSERDSRTEERTRDGEARRQARQLLEEQRAALDRRDERRAAETERELAAARAYIDAFGARDRALQNEIKELRSQIQKLTETVSELVRRTEKG